MSRLIINNVVTIQWRIQNFIMGADGRGEGSGEGAMLEWLAMPPPLKKIEFLPENGGFWCILELLFTFMQKLVRSTGGRLPRPPGSATVTIWMLFLYSYTLKCDGL